MVNLQYDPNRSANIALIEYEDGERRYILAPNGLKAGHIIKRIMPRAQGRAYRINKRTSHVTIAVSER